MTQKISVINVRVSSQMIEAMDSIIAKGIYNSRSELIRELCRSYVLEERKNNA